MERDERRTRSGHLFVCVVPVTLLTVLLGAWGCFSLPPLSVLFYRSRVFNPWEAAGMNRCRGWKCAGRQSYRGVQFTVSYIAAIVFLSASISSYVTCGKDVKFCCFVWVVGHKRFSCLMLLLLKGERWASVVPVRPPQITAMFLCLMVFFFFLHLFIESALSEAKASVLGEPPDVFSYFTFSSKDLPSTCLCSSYFWKQCQQNNL